MPKSLGIETAIIHNFKKTSTNAEVAEPISLSTTFHRESNGLHDPEGFIYSRASNPNRISLERNLALLENATAALAFSSGMAATYAIFQSLENGSHIILPDDIYYGTKLLIDKILTESNISYSIVDMSNNKFISAAINTKTKLIWIESPSNPSLKICDIKATADLAKKHNIITVCDNTWATPFHTKPLELGVDIVMHSSSKYFGGHSDILGGAIMWSGNLNTDLSQKLKDCQTLGGGVPSPFDCWLLNRSLMTFQLRMTKHAYNAHILAQYLESHEGIERVYYPGLPSHPQHDISLNQMHNGFGGMISIIIKGNEQNCINVASRLKVFNNATSLGGVESLVDHRKSAEGVYSTSAPNLLRISVGIENIDDLIDDFKQALN